MTNRLLTIPETAAALGLKSTNAVYERISDGSLRAVDIAKPGAKRSKTRVREDDVKAYIEGLTRVAPKRGAA